MNRLHRWICRSGFWKKFLQSEILPWALKDVDLGQNLLEVGPGPGLTTDFLRSRFDRITALEVDPALADLLKRRMNGTNVAVIQGDASDMPFENATFSGAVAFTMLHHVPSPTLQDQLLREVYRVLRPGGMFAGTDSVWSPGLWLIHIGDTLVSVDPGSFKSRLESAGFTDVQIELEKKRFRFSARRAENFPAARARSDVSLASREEIGKPTRGEARCRLLS